MRRRARVLSLVLLINLSQLVMWTDANGVVHVDEAGRAPAKARPMSGDGYSRIGDDARTDVMPDGGTRDDDTAMWRQRFTVARAALAEASAREDDAASAIQAATREVCATATAHAETSLGVYATRGGTVVVDTRSVTPLRRGQSAHFSNTATSSSQRCERGTSTPAQHEALRRARAERLEAARVLSSLEAEARRASIPLRYWR